jgi:hypothetical protein
MQHKYKKLNIYFPSVGNEMLFFFLSFRLKDAQDQLCDVTKELVEVKKDRGNQELKWTIERNKILHNLELCQERLGENYPSASGFAVSGSGRSLKLKSSQQLCAQIDSLKVRQQFDATDK